MSSNSISPTGSLPTSPTTTEENAQGTTHILHGIRPGQDRHRPDVREPNTTDMRQPAATRTIMKILNERATYERAGAMALTDMLAIMRQIIYRHPEALGLRELLRHAEGIRDETSQTLTLYAMAATCKMLASRYPDTQADLSLVISGVNDFLIKAHNFLPYIATTTIGTIISSRSDSTEQGSLAFILQLVIPLLCFLALLRVISRSIPFSPSFQGRGANL